MAIKHFGSGIPNIEEEVERMVEESQTRIPVDVLAAEIENPDETETKVLELLTEEMKVSGAVMSVIELGRLPRFVVPGAVCIVKRDGIWDAVVFGDIDGKTAVICRIFSEFIHAVCWVTVLHAETFPAWEKMIRRWLERVKLAGEGAGQDVQV